MNNPTITHEFKETSDGDGRGRYTINYDDGRQIIVEYDVTGGKGRGHEIIKNELGLSEQAVDDLIESSWMDDKVNDIGSDGPFNQEKK